MLVSVLVALLASAQAGPAAADVVATRSVWIAARAGSIAGLRNPLTGESYVSGLGATPARLHRLGATPDGPTPQPSADRSSRGVLLHRLRSGEDRLTTRFEADADGSVRVKQDAAGARPGVYGVSWSAGIIPERLQVLVPGNSGQRFGSDAPYETRVFEYPMGWEAPFVIIQGPRGGALIHAEDPGLSPKVLTVERVVGGFRLRFESRNEAPFEPLTRVAGKPWVIRTFRGGWQTGVAIYRKWSARALGIVPIAAHRPRWAAGIRFVVIMQPDLRTLRQLARRADPKQTLLYVPNWRRDGYDRNYPDYTAIPEFGPFVTEAHRLGFRVMPHVNYFGCDPKNPEYERLRKYQMRDPFTRELQWWDWKLADPPIKFAYINPASREWRALFVERMKELCRRYEVDALHLDQTLCILNDANGRIDGMSCAEGNLALHRELKQALPDVALSGEGLNEVTCRYEEFAQRHVWGMDHVSGTWNDRQIDMAHPVASSVLLPSTTMYGYLGLPNPLAAPDAYTAWMRAYERYGVIPTYAWPTPDQLGPPAAPAVERLLRRAGLFMRYGPQPDFSTPWSPDELFVWRTFDGGKVRFVRRQGVALEMHLAGQAAPLALDRRIEGVETFTGPGSVAGWPAYDDGGVFGLDPRRRYDWSPEPADARALHLASAPPGWHLDRAGAHADLLRVGLEAHGGASVPEVRLWEAAKIARAGVVSPGSRPVAVQGVHISDDVSGGQVRPDGEGLFMHPPWKGRHPTDATRLGLMSFVEYRLKLADRPGLRFEAGAHLRIGAGESDGVRFRVSAWTPARSQDRLMAEAIATGSATVPLVLELGSLRGRDVVLRIEADAGPAGDPTFDWGRLDQPRVVADPSLQPRVSAVLRFAGVAPVKRVLAAYGTLKVTPAATGGTLVETDLPNVLTIPSGEPLEVTEPFDLAALPLTARTRSGDGTEGPPPQYGPAVGPAACGGVERRAIHEHPPTRGATLLDYFLKLPSAPVQLVTAIGVRDGSKSAGVGFRVEANGKVLFSQDLKPGSGWIPVRVDLSAYAGREVMLTLVTDALGEFNFDWAVWAEPAIVRTH